MAQKSYAPPPGNPERKAILEALREGLKRDPVKKEGSLFLYGKIPEEASVNFLVDYIKIKEDWAWVEARGKDYDADLFALLLKKEKKWTIQGMVDPRIYPCPDLGECHHIGQFIYKKFKERFPSAPVEIFPEEHPECRAILIALREGLKAHHPGSMHFIVRYLKVKEGWAWVETDPRVSEKILEPLDALLQKVGGKWQVKDIRPCCGDCEEDPYCAKRIYHKKLIRLFPSVPKEIFPLQTR